MKVGLILFPLRIVVEASGLCVLCIGELVLVADLLDELDKLMVEAGLVSGGQPTTARVKYEQTLAVGTLLAGGILSGARLLLLLAHLNAQLVQIEGHRSAAVEFEKRVLFLEYEIAYGTDPVAEVLKRP